ncbi:MAG: hypothetical protein Q8K30_00440 [Candidatus Gracilibacteria bacterium]|nr:hypothetical protein [Candidatus Gracilibacteria bacterium]
MNKPQSHNIDLNKCAIEKTLVKLGEGFQFSLEKDFTPITMQKDYLKNKKNFFLVGDEIIINKINIREKNQTIEVKFTHTREGKETSKMEMSGAIFLQYFLSSIDVENIVLNEVTDKVKEKVEQLITDIGNTKNKQIKKAEKKGGLDILKIFKFKKKNKKS